MDFELIMFMLLAASAQASRGGRGQRGQENIPKPPQHI